MAWKATKEAAGDALGTVGKAADVRDKIGAWCASLGAIGVGALLWVGPEEIAEEIPVHREVGAGFVAFGVVFVLALSLRGNAGYRARSLMFAMIAALGAVGLGYLLYHVGRDVVDLHERGEYRTVEVVGQSLRFDQRTGKASQKTKVRVEGKTVSVELDGRYRRGDTAEVLVVPDRPDVVVSGAVEQDWVQLVDAKFGKWGLLLLALVFVICVLAAPIKLWDALVGPPAGVDPDADAP